MVERDCSGLFFKKEKIKNESSQGVTIILGLNYNEFISEVLKN